MLPSLTLALDEITHELAYELRGWPVRRLGFGHESIAQFGFKLDSENGFFGHGSSRCKDDELYHYLRQLLD